MKFRDPQSLNLSEEVKGKLRQFNRALISYFDFQQASSLAYYIAGLNLEDERDTDRLLAQGLTCGLIVAYSRPFTRNEAGDSTTSRIPDRFLDTMDLDERELHEYVLERRNKAVAHSDADAWNIEGLVVRIGERGVVYPLHNQVHTPLTQDATLLLAGMSTRLLEACVAERRRLEPELLPYLRELEVSGPE